MKRLVVLAALCAICLTTPAAGTITPADEQRFAKLATDLHEQYAYPHGR